MVDCKQTEFGDKGQKTRSERQWESILALVMPDLRQ